MLQGRFSDPDLLIFRPRWADQEVMKVRIAEPRLWSGAAARTLMAAGGVAAFLFAASLFEPDRGRAAEFAPKATAGNAPATGGTHLGTLRGREISVQVRATGSQVRYTILDGMGNILGADLLSEDVARDFPDIDPATMLAAPRSDALMMAIDRE